MSGIILNRISENSIHIRGKHGKIVVRGFASLVKVIGNQRNVWQYNLNLFYDGKMVHVSSSPREGTLCTEEQLMARIKKVCEGELDVEKTT